VTTAHESSGGGFRHSLFWKLLGAFVILAVLPLVGTGFLVAVQMGRVREQADHISRTYERRAERIAARVSDLLGRCESDLVKLSKLERTDGSYSRFAGRHKREVWIRAGTDNRMSEDRLDVPLYKEISFIDKSGMEKVLIVRGRPVPADQRRNVSDPLQTTYRNEKYFSEAMKLAPGEIYVSHLTGFHVNKIEQLGIEKVIPRLKKRSSQDKQIYRYLLFEILRIQRGKPHRAGLPNSRREPAHPGGFAPAGHPGGITGPGTRVEGAAGTVGARGHGGGRPL